MFLFLLLETVGADRRLPTALLLLLRSECLKKVSGTGLLDILLLLNNRLCITALAHCQYLIGFLLVFDLFLEYDGSVLLFL